MLHFVDSFTYVAGREGGVAMILPFTFDHQFLDCETIPGHERTSLQIRSKKQWNLVPRVALKQELKSGKSRRGMPVEGISNARMRLNMILQYTFLNVLVMLVT